MSIVFRALLFHLKHSKPYVEVTEYTEGFKNVLESEEGVM